MKLLLAFVCVVFAVPAHAAPSQAPEVIGLWPGEAPGTRNWTGPEEEVDADLPSLGKVHIVTNVTVPTLTVVRPTAGSANGTAMIVVPGGAFRALPWDLDGTETAQWLAARGVTAFILKYRVRPPAVGAHSRPESFEAFAERTRSARSIAIADAKRALAIIRSSASHYGIASDKIGMIGFSAGAMTVMSLAVAKSPAQRPDIAVALYGALLEPGRPPAGAPPLFVVAAQDDAQTPPLRSVDMVKRWTNAGLSAELHLYERGGHGFAFRPHNLPSDRWTVAFETWLGSRGYINTEKVGGTP
jgi:acetyl esterase/lipase